MFSTALLHEPKFMLLIGLLSQFPYHKATFTFKVKSNSVTLTNYDYQYDKGKPTKSTWLLTTDGKI